MGQALRRSGASFDCGRRRFVRQGFFGATRCAAGAASLAMTRLVVTADAEADTSSILDYLEREGSPRIAENYGRRFRAAIVRFVDLPETGPLRPALGQNVRVAIVFSYVLIYEYVPQDYTVTLLRVLHGRRNITRELLKPNPL